MSLAECQRNSSSQGLARASYTFRSLGKDHERNRLFLGFVQDNGGDGVLDSPAVVPTEHHVLRTELSRPLPPFARRV